MELQIENNLPYVYNAQSPGTVLERICKCLLIQSPINVSIDHIWSTHDHQPRYGLLDG